MQSDGPLRPLTVQTFLSLPNGQMHSVIFTSSSYNDKRVRGWIGVLEEGVVPSMIHWSVFCFLSITKCVL